MTRRRAAAAIASEDGMQQQAAARRPPLSARLRPSVALEVGAAPQQHAPARQQPQAVQLLSPEDLTPLLLLAYSAETLLQQQQLPLQLPAPQQEQLLPQLHIAPLTIPVFSPPRCMLPAWMSELPAALGPVPSPCSGGGSAGGLRGSCGGPQHWKKARHLPLQ
jgi:hypothetical protein